MQVEKQICKIGIQVEKQIQEACIQTSKSVIQDLKNYVYLLYIELNKKIKK